MVTSGEGGDATESSRRGGSPRDEPRPPCGVDGFSAGRRRRSAWLSGLPLPGSARRTTACGTVTVSAEMDTGDALHALSSLRYRNCAQREPGGPAGPRDDHCYPHVTGNRLRHTRLRGRRLVERWPGQRASRSRRRRKRSHPRHESDHLRPLPGKSGRELSHEAPQYDSVRPGRGARPRFTAPDAPGTGSRSGARRRTRRPERRSHPTADSASAPRPRRA